MNEEVLNFELDHISNYLIKNKVIRKHISKFKTTRDAYGTYRLKEINIKPSRTGPIKLVFKKISLKIAYTVTKVDNKRCIILELYYKFEYSLPFQKVECKDVVLYSTDQSGFNKSPKA